MDSQVIVVGAGPVGLLLAGELRLGGADVLVLERLAEPTRQSRASVLHARTMEFFDERGLLARLGTSPSEGAGHYGGLPLDLSRVASRYAGQWKVPQARTEELLYGWAVDLGAVMRRGYEVRGLAVRREGVELTGCGPGGPFRLRTDYVVGCDGEDSLVRRLGEFDFPGTDAGRELLRADITGTEVAPRRFHRTANGIANAARRPDGSTRLMVHEFGRVRGGATEPDYAEIAAVWARVTGEDISGGTATWANRFGDALRQASQYRKGRVLLAGDAAHCQPPIGGQGLNLGLQDAANLGWKLAAEVRGWAPAGLLDTYHDERHNAGARVLGNIAAQALLLFGGPEVEPVRGVLRELLRLPRVADSLAAAISGVDVRYPGVGDHPLLGVRLPMDNFSTDAGLTSTAELLREARGLLLDLSPEAAARPAGRWADRVRVVRATRRRLDLLADVAAVLVRPDGHVVWTDAGPEDLEAALRRWFGAPDHQKGGR